MVSDRALRMREGMTTAGVSTWSPAFVMLALARVSLRCRFVIRRCVQQAIEILFRVLRPVPEPHL